MRLLIWLMAYAFSLGVSSVRETPTILYNLVKLCIGLEAMSQRETGLHVIDFSYNWPWKKQHFVFRRKVSFETSKKRPLHFLQDVLLKNAV